MTKSSAGERGLSDVDSNSFAKACRIVLKEVMTLRKTTALQLARSSAKTVSEKLRRSCLRVVVLPDLNVCNKRKEKEVWGVKKEKGNSSFRLGDVRDHNREEEGDLRFLT